MGATLDALHRLQRTELELIALRQSIDGKYRAVQICEKKLQKLDAEIASLQLQARHEQAEADRAELDRKSREQEIARLREALNRAKTNKEYSALLTQINTEKADSAKLEEKVLKMYEAVDRLKASLRQLQENRAKEAERLHSLRKSAAEFETSVRPQLEQLQALRAAAAENLPTTALRLFERVAEKHDGEGLARVVQSNPRREEYVCSGCNMGVTLEQISALRGRDDLQICHTCGRILYIEEPAVSAPGKTS